MGNNCGCINKANKEEKTEFSFPKPSPAVNMGESYYQVVKIQSAFRGYLARKKLYDLQMNHYNERVIQSLRELAAAYFASKFKHIKPFTYDLQEDLKDPNFERRVFKPVQQFPAGGTYLGEW